MKSHSMIFDEFFKDPHRARALINNAEMKDEKYSDGVTYPNITRLPKSVEEEIISNIEGIFGPITPVISFARYSFEGVTPPHWAHSDREIAEYLALIYLSDGDSKAGTSILRHKGLNFETHPTDELRKSVLLAHANKRDEWEVTYTCPAKFNRFFVLNADLVHAAMGEYGKTKDDGRLVVSIFFNLGRQQ